MAVSATMLAVTWYLFKSWQTRVPDHDQMPVIKLIMAMMVFDLLTFAVDMFMVIRRWKFFIALRNIISAIAFTVGVMVQIHTVSYLNKNGTFEIDFSDGV
mmetsp:Transcript_17077/g.26421  ORF Transcript_17077/g.26421 Transcript_17077/m.26421 type:complete len:100 (-) Transcript_17077:201-500(-)